MNRDPLGLRRNLQGFADLVFELYWRDNAGVPGEYDILLCHSRSLRRASLGR